MFARVFPHGQVRASIENGFASGYIYARDARSRRFERMHFYFVAERISQKRGRHERKIEGTEYVHTALHTTWNEVEGLWSHLIWTADNW